MEPQHTLLTLEIRLFGSFDVRLNGAPLPPLRSRKGQWLLGLLVLKQSQPVDRAWLAGTLWPEAVEENALTSLRQSLTDLRNALGAEAPRLQSPTPRTLTLDLSGVFCDLTAFDAAVSRGDTKSLEQAVALYRGPLLEECAEEWLLLERNAREQTYLRLLETLAAQKLDHGETTAAIEYLQLCIGQDPLRESAQRKLMQALAAGGNCAAVTQVFRDLRLYLRRELNSDPDPDTTALYQQLRADAQELARRPLPAPESRTAPPERRTAPPAPVGISLPHPVTELIGRESEILEIQTCLQRASLVTLTGTGGVGKTRLALQIAHQSAEEFPEGVWFVDLAALSDPTLVGQTVASVLGVREQAGMALSEALVQHLQHRALLVLDNCEHVLPECVRLASALLHRCPQLRLLATSRQALGITGEVVWRVPSLARPNPERLSVQKDLVSILMDYDAIRLFVNRASLVQPTFRLTPQNAGAVAQICARLDGIPLAIELAAARSRVLTAEQIAPRLDDRFALLTGGSRDALPRQQTLRAALDWSYELLTDTEQCLLGRLSVFAGGWTLEAAEQVCTETGKREKGKGKREGDPSFPLIGNAEVLDLLTSLVDKSLVSFETTDAGEGRYRLLETVRVYATERLRTAGEREAVQARHFDYFLAWTEEAAAQLHSPEQTTWLDRLGREHDNLRAALQFGAERWERAAEDGQEPLIGWLRLVATLWGFWEVRGYWSEGRVHLDAALAHAEAVEPVLRMNLLSGSGDLAQRQGDYTTARARFDACLVLAREMDDPKKIASVLRSLGTVACDQGDFATAQSCFEESLSVNRALEDRRGIATDLVNLATVAQPRGEYATAYRLLKESLTVFRELGDKIPIGIILNNLGNTAYAEGDYTAARAYFEESLAIRRELGNRRGIANTLQHLGNVALEVGDYPTAQRLMEESLVIRREIGETQQVAFSLHNLGRLAQSQGDYATAHSLHRESITILRQLMSRQALAHCLEAFGSLAMAEAQGARAARLWGAAEALREVLGTPGHLNQRAQQEQEIASVRERLGEEAFATAWREGLALNLEQAVDYALQPSPP